MEFMITWKYTQQLFVFKVVHADNARSLIHQSLATLCLEAIRWQLFYVDLHQTTRFSLTETFRKIEQCLKSVKQQDVKNESGI